MMAKDSICLAVEKNTDTEAFLYEFYLHPDSRFQLSLYKEDVLKSAAEKTFEILAGTEISRILDVIESHMEELPEIVTSNIPQFSSITDIDVIPRIVETNPGCEYAMMGYYFNKDGKYDAQRKYGENHYKAAALLGLVTEEAPFGPTYLGREYAGLPEELKEAVKSRLCLRVPIIDICLIEGRKGPYDGMKEVRKLLTESTSVRRRSSMKQMINQILKAMPEKDRSVIIENINWK